MFEIKVGKVVNNVKYQWLKLVYLGKVLPTIF